MNDDNGNRERSPNIGSRRRLGVRRILLCLSLSMAAAIGVAWILHFVGTEWYLYHQGMALSSELSEDYGYAFFALLADTVAFAMTFIGCSLYLCSRRQ